jgi:hypothetical protein
MSRLRSVCLLFCSMACPAPAGPREDVIVAAMRLTEQANYTWVATVADDARTYDINGRTSREGYARVRMPAVNSLRRRLGRSVTDTDIEFIFRGNVDCVILTEQGWKKPQELAVPPSETEYEKIVSPTGALGVPGSRSISGGILKGTVIRPVGPPPDDEHDPKRSYSNLQLGLSLPHEELGIIVSSHASLAVNESVASGTLTELGAQLLLVRDGQKELTPLRGAGTFKLWLRNGGVEKYQVRLEGIVQVDTPSGRRQLAVTQTTETIVKNVGTTQVEVPEEAIRKLGR